MPDLSFRGQTGLLKLPSPGQSRAVSFWLNRPADSDPWWVFYDADMKRTTLMLPDDLAQLLEMERKRRDVSTAELVRRALRSYLVGEENKPRSLSFVGLGRSGTKDTSERVEEILQEEWGRQRKRGR